MCDFAFPNNAMYGGTRIEEELNSSNIIHRHCQSHWRCFDPFSLLSDFVMDQFWSIGSTHVDLKCMEDWSGFTYDHAACHKRLTLLNELSYHWSITSSACPSKCLLHGSGFL